MVQSQAEKKKISFQKKINSYFFDSLLEISSLILTAFS